MSFLLSSDFFTNKVLVTPCILENKKQNQLISLLNIDTISIAFTDKTIAYIIYKALEIFFIKLAKPKSLKNLMID